MTGLPQFTVTIKRERLAPLDWTLKPLTGQLYGLCGQVQDWFSKMNGGLISWSGLIRMIGKA